MNERIEIVSGDIGYQQLAQTGRTMFTPGKAASLASDMNWPTENRIPTGTPAFSGEAAGPVEMGRSRVELLGRGIICNQTIPTPVILDTRVETRTENGIAGTNTTQDTEGFTRPVAVEKTTGNDNIIGA